ncbi:Uma2 family endonuclease [Litoribacter ruber]|uniref:Uma2 family endonuclease n=1 Tax=Litoribacter ruber TaxID=702568 RepID=UPI001BD9B973|nr:Uma2 family endonuclease [Litoribacter ruber]MBT0811110.1 Uma2 family endonuclease [Litoribacter ruber]
MEKGEKNSQLEEPFSECGRYTYADYLTWEIDGMVELIKGKVFRQPSAPKRIHQEISREVSMPLYNYLDRGTCQVYVAPFDVRLPFGSKKNEDITTVVQPDICVICDPGKLDDAGCIGAPDLVVEILSPGDNRKELKDKYEVYQESGVKEYWVIQPETQNFLIYTLHHGYYKASKLYTTGDVIESSCIKGFKLDLDEVFDRVK